MIRDNEEISKIFRKNPKIDLGDECVVVSATDSDTFRHFQLLCLSLKYSHNVKITLFDLGMKDEEKSWCLKQKMEIKGVRNLIFTKKTPGWQTYSKPLYIQGATSYFEKNPKYALWLDADCVVLKDLSPLFDHIRKRPLATLCHHWPDAPRNNPDLHQIMKSEKPENPPYVNAGVCGFHLERDMKLLLQWEWLLRRASFDENIKNKIVFWDQGALQWVLERNKLLGEEILHDMTWNAPVYLSFDFQEVLNTLQNCPYAIAHAAGRGKMIQGVSVALHWKQ